MKKIFLATLLLFIQLGFAQDEKFIEEELEINELTEGTLTKPANEEAESLIIFIQGSGPTDRNGNQAMMNNDGMKKMARELAENGIASFRFDKRIFKMQKLEMKLEELKFSDLVGDVENILAHFKEKDEFENIVIAGHSQGSLIGILAINDDVDGFISLAGPGRPIDDIIVDQFSKMAPEFGQSTRVKFDELRENGSTENDNPMLASIFAPYVQPFIKSWIQYDPAEEIKKIEVPILIINGTFDIQTEPMEAELLHAANKDSRMVLLENMNHIFRKVESKDRLVNTKSYNEPNRPLHPELIPTITSFIKELE
ncbi:alpha/beta hydrolase family protein [Christiangramia sp. SM2212]|uniref:Alpha/beta hydrolase n=1 Tax=Christiangramia sediminicola TaxID=3073267 RepID=A0ABU1ER71_9FLAO|nr:alpha/beta hydrolase [Christiangramia sp. SM2212]MDR5590890.1 alpha/beta hydrolase [Christiangramia sp. SM2212]